MKILIVYSTTDGHTLEICQRLQKIIEAQNHKVTLVSIDEVAIMDLTEFQKIVIGASIRYGKHSQKIIDFINLNQKILESKPNAFFSVNVVARKPEKNKPHNNPYLLKFLKRISWKPKELAVFAGKIDYPKYTFFDRLVIRLIMWMTEGPTDSDTVMDYTDWQSVNNFGQVISNMS